MSATGSSVLALLLVATMQAADPPPPPAPADGITPEVDPGLIDGRRRPGTAQQALPPAIVQDNPGAISAPPPEAFPTDTIPLPDRWRIMTSLCPPRGGDQSIYQMFGALREVCRPPTDPYHQNALKGDRPIDRAKVPWLPIKGDDWFFNVGFISDTLAEPRSFPLPTGGATTQRPGSNDLFGRDTSYVLSQTFLLSMSLLKGSTAFMPPHIEYHVALAFNLNYARVPERQILNVDAARAPHRFDNFLALQEAFVDYHLRDTTARYDFDAIRVGIQPMQADFRGFLFNDQQLGVRLFGNRDNNRVQYNLAAFWRLEKDTNSGLNDVTQRPRRDMVFLANLYRQDLLVPGFTGQATIVYNRNRERGEHYYDANGFPVRPALIGNLKTRNYDVVYLGLNADGHIHRVNVTASAYHALGSDRDGNYSGREGRIDAWFAAAELSYDRDWMRFRASGLFASGDADPYDKRETGYDAIFENPIFAGADTSYWIRQSVPFIGGGRGVALSQRNGILHDLRTSKDLGQSNFVNPGTILAGVGGDFDLTPTFRLAVNANHLWFHRTAVLKVLRQQGNIARDIGYDLSCAATWRPKATNNIVMRLSGATLLPGRGMKDLFDNSSGDRRYYSILANAIVSF